MKNKQNLVSLTIIIFLIGSTGIFFSASVNGQVLYLADSIDLVNKSSSRGINGAYPTSGSIGGGYSQEFTGDGKLLVQINFDLAKTYAFQSDQAYAHVDVFLDNTTYSGSPMGDILDSAIPVDVSTFASYTNFAPVYFYFNGTLLLENGVHYVARLTLSGAITDANYVMVSEDDSSVDGNHDVMSYIPTTPYFGWYDFESDAGLIFYVFTMAPEVTPTPAPTPTATPSYTHGVWNGTHWVNDDNTINQYTDLLLPVLIPLIVILVCAGLGAYFIGLWGFILGLDVAIVLLYVALPTYMPLWGVVLVGIGNIIVLMLGRNREGG